MNGDVIIIAGKKFVSVEALRAAANSELTTFNCALCLKVGFEKNEALHRVLGVMLASYASAACGEIPPLHPNPAHLAWLHRPARSAKLEDMPGSDTTGGRN